jgi:histone deacetylase 1/2
MSVELGHLKPGWRPATNWEVVRPLSSCVRYILGADKFHLRADLPVNEYYEYFGPDYKLDVRSSNMEDRNSVEYLERIKNVVMEHLREIGGPPGVQMIGQCELRAGSWHVLNISKIEIPRLPHDDLDEDEELDDPEDRKPRECCLLV